MKLQLRNVLFFDWQRGRPKIVLSDVAGVEPTESTICIHLLTLGILSALSVFPARLGLKAGSAARLFKASGLKNRSRGR